MTRFHAPALAALALLGLAAHPRPAAAQQQYDFSLSGPSAQAQGTLTVVASGVPGQFYVTGITGTQDGQPITGLVPTASPGVTQLSADGAFLYNNVFYAPAAPDYVDYWGILFTTAGDEFNWYNDHGTHLDYSKNTGAHVLTTLSATPSDDLGLQPSPAPEPSQLAALGLGILGLGGLAFRARKRHAC